MTRKKTAKSTPEQTSIPCSAFTAVYSVRTRPLLSPLKHDQDVRLISLPRPVAFQRAPLPTFEKVVRILFGVFFGLSLVAALGYYVRTRTINRWTENRMRPRYATAKSIY